jgi:hypothetical protein
MGLLRFTDTQGREWEVWEVGARPLAADLPLPRNGGGAPERWLCFASGVERRRLLSYPQRWETLTARQLEALCRAASPSRRTTPTSGPAIPPPDRRDR